ncbi:MAG: 4Fe-4S dicluster domain-containing protein [Spirochaetales bacterium]|jgi:NADH dehydrogenase/NADH:ubiquinone oxidoreductase subunit G|nr:4Fe-4S dicluster domain-containing protein [Spirochaetales bacterium]
MSIEVKIDGKICPAEKDEYILEIARRNRILIPSLCHHDALPGLGCCRLCVVEINEGRGNRVVVSCVYPVRQDCEVLTGSERIKGIRRTIISMLSSRAPEGGRLGSLRGLYQVSGDSRFSSLAGEKCILCGLCVEACAELGSGAITTAGRGVEKKVTTPFDRPSRDCIGCLSCAAVCPTGAIEAVQTAETRTIWGREFELLRCEACGRPFATPEEAAHAALLNGGSPPAPGEKPPRLCAPCRQKRTAGVMAAAFAARS